MADTEQFVYDIISYFTLGSIQQDAYVVLQNITPINEAFNDRTYGWVATLTYNEEGVYSYCDFPN